MSRMRADKEKKEVFFCPFHKQGFVVLVLFLPPNVRRLLVKNIYFYKNKKTKN